MKNENEEKNLTESNRNTETVKKVLYDIVLNKQDGSVEELFGMWIPIRPKVGNSLLVNKQKFVVEEVDNNKLILKGTQ